MEKLKAWPPVLLRKWLLTCVIGIGCLLVGIVMFLAAGDRVMLMISGLLAPDSGAVLVEGEDIRSKDQDKLRRNIGYAIQGSVLFPHMSVEQNIAYVPNLLNRRDKKRTREAVDKWMRIVGLDGELKRRCPAGSSSAWA